MVTLYLIMYVFFGWLILMLFKGFLEDCQEKSNKENWGLLKKWAPEFITLLLFGCYVFWALHSLSSMDWSFINQ